MGLDNLDRLLEIAPELVPDELVQLKLNLQNQQSIFTDMITKLSTGLTESNNREDIIKYSDALQDTYLQINNLNHLITDMPHIEINLDDDLVCSDVYDDNGKVIDNFTGKRPYAYQLDGRTVSVESWRDLYINMMVYIYNIDHVMFERYVDNDELKGRVHYHIASSRANFKDSHMIDVGIYIELNRSPVDILGRIKDILNVYGYDIDAFKVCLTDNI